MKRSKAIEVVENVKLLPAIIPKEAIKVLLKTAKQVEEVVWNLKMESREYSENPKEQKAFLAGIDFALAMLTEEE